MPENLLPGNVINRTTGVTVVASPIGNIVTIVGVADIIPTVALTFDLKERSSIPDRPDTVIGVVPVGASIFYVGLRIPSSPAIIATNGDRLKLAPAVTATGAQTFDAAGATTYAASAVAAGGTFAAAQARFSITPYSQAAAASQAAATSAALTFKLFSDNGTNGAGSGVSVASGSAQVICMIKYVMPGLEDVPDLRNLPARPNRA